MLEKLNPTFVFGGTTASCCDCLGLLLLVLRAEGFICPWEKEVRRDYRTAVEIGRLCGQMGAVTSSYTAATGKIRKLPGRPRAVGFAVMDFQGMGHLCVLDGGRLWHMSRYGLRELPLVDAGYSWFLYTGE